jgi:hypothetical protein
MHPSLLWCLAGREEHIDGTCFPDFPQLKTNGLLPEAWVGFSDAFLSFQREEGKSAGSNQTTAISSPVLSLTSYKYFLR